MNGFLQQRLQLQLFLILLAAVSVAALSALVIWDSIQGAEKAVLGDMGRQLSSALSELKQQYAGRVNSDSSWFALPLSAQDISLRGISQTVLRSYPGVEGGFYVGSQFLGYSFPTHDNPAAKTDVPTAERAVIQEVAEKAAETDSGEHLLRGGHELVLIRAARQQDGVIAWAMERRSYDQPNRIRRVLLVALLLAAILSVAGTLQMAISLRRGVTQIRAGLTTLEKDFAFSLPEGRDELGEISHAINRMASVRRQLEEEVRREDRLWAIGRTVAGIAHEIRNPLNGIRLSMQLLHQRLKRGAVNPEDLDRVVGEVDRMDTLLNDLLAFREKKQPRLEDHELLPIMERCVHLVQPCGGMPRISIQTSPGGVPLRARCDSQRLTQAVMNLLLNAVEAVKADGCVDIKLYGDGDKATIEVHDSGPGLNQEQREHLFEAFYTTKLNGTGLGLAVSRELVEEMSGRLSYKNERPGATFVIEVPAVRNA
jgi:signal transduction histidine kinase